MPVIFQAADSIGGIFSVKCFCVQLLPLLKPIMIFLTFLWGVYLFCKSPYCKPRRRSYRPPWKRVNKFLRHRLHYSLVQCCCCRHGQRPCRLNGSYFPSPHCNKHRRWRRRNTMSRARHKRRRTVKELFLNPSIDPPFQIKKEVPDATLASFCGVSQGFLSLPRLMSKFTEMDHVQNVEKLC